jgi:hypothetical protein
MSLYVPDGDMKESEYFNKSQDFSLVLGGPLYQLLVRARLEDSALGLSSSALLFSPFSRGCRFFFSPC